MKVTKPDSAAWWQKEMFEEFSKGNRVPNNYTKVSKKIASLEKKKADIYNQIEALREQINFKNCNHPMKHLVMEENYSTDTLGKNGRSTYYVTCTICNKHQEFYLK